MAAKIKQIDRYVALISDFWVANEGYSLNPTGVALYLYLLDAYYRIGLNDKFKRTNAKVMADLNISKQILELYRKQLKQCGLIDYRSVQGSSVVTWIIIEPNFEKYK